MHRRAFLASIATLFTAACAEDSGFGLAFRALGSDSDRYTVTPERIAAIPYSTMGFWTGNGVQKIVVMETLEPPYRATWRADDRMLVVTDNGLVTQTSGMLRDLRRYAYDDVPVLTIELIRQLDGRSLKGRIDVSAPDQAGLPFEATFKVGAPQRITILGAEQVVIPVTEQLRLPHQRWKTENRYWFRERDGLVIKGERGFHPDLPPLQWERYIRPAATAA
ncbi:YjbF family lipoprotein [Solimonas soli]|uniref:YjbF family lipoprotein n=1 Tax=Solimonas soli TaxID=413479 RepID=UPI000486359C|nr:YjbF family lipoprotein [Solimonas soli]